MQSRLVSNLLLNLQRLLNDYGGRKVEWGEEVGCLLTRVSDYRITRIQP